MPLALFTIGTSETDYVNLLDPTTLSVVNWEPAEGTTDDIYSSSALADYGQLTNYRETETAESLIIHVMGATQNDCIRNVTRLRQMLRKARDYWTSAHQPNPVYVAARASCESNTRYCIVYAGAVSTDGNPFTQPFVGSSLMADLPFAFTRGPWCDTPPGESECLPIAGVQEIVDGLNYLTFDGVDDSVNCGSGAALDDLPTAATGAITFSAEAWIRATGWGGLNQGTIFSKVDVSGNETSRGWFFSLNNSYGLIFAFYQARYDREYALADLAGFSVDNQWHHVVAYIYEIVGYRVPVIAVDGHWYTSAAATTTPPASDALDDFYIGNVIEGNRAFEGDIGWVRFSVPSPYTFDPYHPNVDFTPPERCVFPLANANTRGLWIKEEGVSAPDYSGNANDGVIHEATWLSDCSASGGIGQESTCLNNVYVANKHNRAQITNIHYWDASAAAWSGNLFGAATPFAFMPPTPMQVNDVVIFGIDTSKANSGPFCSLVFDIATALNPSISITIDWRYSSTAADIVTGPWSSFVHPPLQDNTNRGGTMTGNAFDTPGVNSVHWEQPTDWVAFDPTVNGGVALGTTGYWVAAIVTAVTGAPTPPIQDNRDIYSVLWPYITIDEDVVGGDIPAWLTANMNLCSADWTQEIAGSMNVDQLWMGLRQTSRGENFSAYINLADVQNPSNVTVSPVAPGLFGSYTTTPTGRYLSYTPAGVATDLGIASIQFTAPQQWYGRYRVFLRGQQIAGTSGDVELRISSALSPTYRTNTTEYLPFLTVGNNNDWIDFGEIDLNPRIPGTPDEFYLLIEANVSVVREIRLYDLILIPVDEWAANLSWRPTPYTWTTNEIVTLDGISKPVLGATSQSIKPGGYSGLTTFSFVPEIRMNRDRPIALPNSEQRIWTFATHTPSSGAKLLSKHEVAHRVQLFKQQRYLSMRGDE